VDGRALCVFCVFIDVAGSRVMIIVLGDVVRIQELGNDGKYMTRIREDVAVAGKKDVILRVSENEARLRDCNMEDSVDGGLLRDSSSEVIDVTGSRVVVVVSDDGTDTMRLNDNVAGRRAVVVIVGHDEARLHDDTREDSVDGRLLSGSSSGFMSNTTGGRCVAVVLCERSTDCSGEAPPGPVFEDVAGSRVVIVVALIDGSCSGDQGTISGDSVLLAIGESGGLSCGRFVVAGLFERMVVEEQQRRHGVGYGKAVVSHGLSDMIERHVELVRCGGWVVLIVNRENSQDPLLSGQRFVVQVVGHVDIES
jgi:hypothetical protein